MDIPNFWNKTHELSKVADELFTRFVPAEGQTEYSETEVFRAALKLHHDYYNNGFGNNMSQAIAYIEEYHRDPTPSFTEAFTAIRTAAMEPWTTPRLDKEFVIFIVEVIKRVVVADANLTLTATNRGVFDMPFVEIKYMDEDDEEDYY